MAKSKRYRDAVNRFDQSQAHSLSEALDLCKSFASANFDETVELTIRLGVDPRKADQQIRGTVGLPKGLGKEVRVGVFAEGEAATQARDAGADVVGSDDLAEAIQAGQINFDVLIAHPSQMPKVGGLGRVLGPRGLMPNPKTGTVTDDVAGAVGEFKGGKVEYRTDKFGNVHVPVGKSSFPAADLAENARALIEELHRVRPSAAKGRYLKKVSVCTTMGPGVLVDSNRMADPLGEA